MAAVVGALRVILGADTAAFESGLKSASKSLTSFGSDMKKFAVGIGAAMAGAVIGFGAAVKSTINEMDTLGKQAQKIGIPVEELSKLRLVADLAGISMEELGKAVVKLSKGMEKSKDPFNEANAAFKALSINVKDGTGGLKRADMVMEEIADAFAGFRDGAEKTALAVALFGRAGADMIPFLNQGGRALREAKQEAKDFGLEIGPVTAKQAELFNDNLTRLGAILKGIFTQVTAQLLPVLSSWSDRLVQVAKDSNFVGTATNAILGFLKSLAIGFIDMAETIQKTQVDIHFSWRRITEVFTRGSVLSAEWNAALDAISKSSQANRDKVEGFFKGTTETMTGSAADWHRAAAQMLADYEALAAAAEKFKPAAPTLPNLGDQKKLQEQIDSTRLKIQELKTQFPGLAEGFVSAASGMGDIGKAALKTFFETGQLTGKFLEMNNLMLGFKGGQIFEENLDPITRMNIELEKTHLALKKFGVESGPEFERAMDKIREKAGETWSAIGKNVADFAGSMSSLTKTLGKENKSMLIASKAFGIAQVIINTQIAVMKALADLGPIAGSIAAAAAIASGAAAVATIVAQGMAKGGSFMVPGAGGTDSQFIPIMATPGERVTVETPEQQKQSGGQTTIMLRGKSFGFDDVRELFESINAGMRDGHRFVAVRA